jgi:hypothetical protein
MMEDIDLNQPAELYTARGSGKGQPMVYRRFQTAREAIRFAMKNLSPAMLSRTVLEADEIRLNGDQIRELYSREAE